MCLKINKNPLDIATKIFKREIKSLNELNKLEIKFIINYLKDSQLLTTTQLIEIREKISIEKITEIFKGKIKSYNELTQYNYNLLLGLNFKTKYIDHPIKSCNEYEYGWQESELCENQKLFYFKFFDVLMLDYDNLNLQEVLSRLKEKEETCKFKIYETYAGYHVYLVSEFINHKYAEEFMTDLDCDFFYIKFTIHHGFKIRLSKKLNRNETFIEKFVMDFGKAEDEKKIIKLIKIKENF
tara:strand:- start:1139 stop:1858 length:720 start_codon:yes stop_codon:yes gene_type:complete